MNQRIRRTVWETWIVNQPAVVTGSTWSAADASANSMTLSNGGMTVAQTAATYQCIRDTISRTSGQYYIEFKTAVAPSGKEIAIGLADANLNLANYLGSSTYSVGCFPVSNRVLSSSGFTANYTPGTITPAINDIWALAVDLSAGKVWLAQNNVWLGGGNPATGANPIVTIAAPALGLAYFPTWSGQGSGSGTWTIQPTAASQKYLPPPGYQAWDGGPVTPMPTSTWSVADATAYTAPLVLSNGNLTVDQPGGSIWQAIRTSISKTSGQLYIEILCTGTTPPANEMFGLADSTFAPGPGQTWLGANGISVGIQTSGTSTAVHGGFTIANNPTRPSVATGDVWAMAVDFTAGKFWLGVNNVWLGGANPTTGTLPIVTFSEATVGALFAGIALNSNVATTSWTLQPTAASQKYAPPSGFSPWG